MVNGPLESVMGVRGGRSTKKYAENKNNKNYVRENYTKKKSFTASNPDIFMHWPSKLFPKRKKSVQEISSKTIPAWKISTKKIMQVENTTPPPP